MENKYREENAKKERGDWKLNKVQQINILPRKMKRYIWGLKHQYREYRPSFDEACYMSAQCKALCWICGGNRWVRQGSCHGVVCVFSSVQSLSRVRLFATPWITARQASLSITNSRILPKLMSIESVMPSSHLILCRPLLILPSIPPSIRVSSDESTLRMRWPKCWSFSFSISPSNEHRTDIL